MTSSVLTWTLAAVLLFWAVGAHNRLVRLRGEAYSAFGALESEITRQVELVRTQVPQSELPAGEAAARQSASATAALHAAANQFAACLASARGKPLDAGGIAALSAAQDVLAMAWQRAERDDAHDMAGPQLAEGVLAQRLQLALQTHAATQVFNQAVHRYNAAIAQFPAMLLAWLFGFKPGRAMTHAIGTVLG